MVLWSKIGVNDNYTELIFKFKQYKNANIANLVYYGKTRLKDVQSVWLNSCCIISSNWQQQPWQAEWIVNHDLRDKITPDNQSNHIVGFYKSENMIYLSATLREHPLFVLEAIESAPC